MLRKYMLESSGSYPPYKRRCVPTTALSWGDVVLRQIGGHASKHVPARCCAHRRPRRRTLRATPAFLQGMIHVSPGRLLSKSPPSRKWH